VIILSRLGWTFATRAAGSAVRLREAGHEGRGRGGLRRRLEARLLRLGVQGQLPGLRPAARVQGTTWGTRRSSSSATSTRSRSGPTSPACRRFRDWPIDPDPFQGIPPILPRTAGRRRTGGLGSAAPNHGRHPTRCANGETDPGRSGQALQPPHQQVRPAGRVLSARRVDRFHLSRGSRLAHGSATPISNERTAPPPPDWNRKSWEYKGRYKTGKSLDDSFRPRRPRTNAPRRPPRRRLRRDP
jgi:hypothetical protein